MQDYYKILGIRETASGEDIRARWIELMRKFHPDGKRKGATQDRRLKEINEAYGVLKDSSSRGQYDLSRAYQRKKRNLYLQRVVTPPAILIILLILGLIYLQRPRVATLTESATLPARHLTDMKANPPSSPLPNEPTIPNQTNQRNEINRTNQRDQRDGINETNQNNTVKTSPPVVKSKTSTPIRKPPCFRPKERKSLAALDDKNMPLAHRSTTAVKKQSGRPEPAPLIAKSETSANVPKAAPEPIVEESEIKLNEIPDPDSPEDLNDPNDIKEHKDPNHISVAHLLIAPSSSIRVEGQIVQHKPASLIATEEEVKQFFAHYIDRYTKKDIDGFHSLFSSKAVQNGKDGFEEIKKIYSDFFDQSQELRYHLEETRIEIYQNAVHVKARYKVNQRLKKGGGKKVWRGDIRCILVRENGALKICYLDYKQQKSP